MVPPAPPPDSSGGAPASVFGLCLLFVVGAGGSVPVVSWESLRPPCAGVCLCSGRGEGSVGPCRRHVGLSTGHLCPCTVSVKDGDTEQSHGQLSWTCSLSKSDSPALCCVTVPGLFGAVCQHSVSPCARWCTRPTPLILWAGVHRDTSLYVSERTRGDACYLCSP